MVSLLGVQQTFVIDFSGCIEKPIATTMNDVKTYKNLINHEWVPGVNSRVIHNPTTAEPIAIVPESSSEEVNRAVLAARHAFDEGPWRETTAQQRERILLAMANLVRKHSAQVHINLSEKPIAWY